jgi:hypothetical protein
MKKEKRRTVKKMHKKENKTDAVKKQSQSGGSLQYGTNYFQD